MHAPTHPNGHPQAPAQQVEPGARMRAILQLFFDDLDDIDDAELERRKKLAPHLASMSDEEIEQALHGEGQAEPQQREGDLLRHMRGGEDQGSRPFQYAAGDPLRVPGEHKIGGQQGGQFVGAQTLARWYASLWNNLEAAGFPPPDHEIETAESELHPHGWTLDRDDETGLWFAEEIHHVERAKGPIRHARGGEPLQYAAKRSPKGGIQIGGKHYPGGQFIPSAVADSPEGQAALAQATEKGKALPSRTGAKARIQHKVHTGEKVDRDALMRSLDSLIGDTEINSFGRDRANRIWKLWQHHHGAEGVLHRLQEVAQLTEHALLHGKEEARAGLRWKLAEIRHMMGLETAQKTGPERPRAGSGSTMAAGGTGGTGHVASVGGGGETGGLPGRQPVGARTGAAPAPDVPGAGGGTGGDGRPGALPGGAGGAGDEQGGSTAGSGDTATGGAGTGTGGPVPGAAGGAGPAGTLGEGGGRGERGAGGDAIPGEGADGQPAAPTPVEESLAEPPTPENPTDLAAGNFRYSDREFAKGGLKTKYRQNIEAIRTLRTIKAEGRDTATPEEQTVLSKYVGWGQFKAVFGYYGGEWEKERQEVRALLSDEEYESARASTLNAHYTHPDVVDAHWKMAQRLGFQGGRFLETSAGIGYYLGMMPEDLASKTRASAVELDSLTGEMLKLLYPKANVKAQKFEEFESPDHFYDLVASNVPFGDYGVHDPRYNKHQAHIHDYFFLKSLDKVRPGGLVMHITSAGTMDKQNASVRQELMKNCDLVSAIRFPKGTHKDNAGTEVVTDMLVLRKRGANEQPVDPHGAPDEAQPEDQGFTGITTDSLGRLYHWVNGKRVPGPKWDDTVMVPDPAGGEPIPVNRYFAEHPEQVLGTVDRSGSMYHGAQVSVSKTEDYEERLQAAIERLPQGLMKTARAPRERFAPETAPAPGDTKEGGYQVQGGKVYTREGGQMVEQEVDGKTLERITGHLGIRDAVRAVINDQLQGKDASGARTKLNEVYDAYTKKHGFLNLPVNRRAFKTDPDAPVLLALEKFDPKTKQATKADIFHKDVIGHAPSVDRAGTVPEALGISLHETGGVDVERMAQLLDATPEHVGRQLVASGIAFQDPQEGWKPADQYLSGNVRRKLALARAAAAADPRFNANVTALEMVQPEDIDYNDIDVKLGSSWVSPSDVKDFAASLLAGRADAFEINYVAATGAWIADFGKDHSAKRLSQGQQARQVWATDRADFMKLFEAALNSTSVTVYDASDDGKTRAVNRQATEDANAKIGEIKEAFKHWVWEDDDRRARLHRHYNDNFNNIRNIKYDGSHQTFPGMNPSFKMRDHQKNFVWQVVTTGKGLAAHEVGTGKAQPVDAKILTPSGWVRMGDVRAGDEVIAGDGSRTTVEAVFPQGEKEIFRVTFSDGSATECCEEHLWLTQTYRERNQAINFRRFARSEWDCDKPKVRSLAEIRETLVSPHLGAKNHSIPLVGAVDFQASSVPVPPYMLGVLLGDGSIGSGTPKISNASEDVEIIDCVRRELPAGLVIRQQPHSAGRQSVGGVAVERRCCPSWGIARDKQVGFGANRHPNPLVVVLKGLGLFGRRSHDKFIPDCYKFNTADVRLSVLQGLLDTDGTISGRKERSVTFYTVSDRLADDVVFLTQSLGGIVRRSMKYPNYTYKGEKKQGRPCHVLCLCLPPDVVPFRLQRKVDRVVPKSRYRPARYIVGVESVGKKQAQCIRVAHSSHLYVTDDFVVTHNTASLIASAMELRRLGMARKPAIACLKANVEAITRDALHLYPGAKILSTADMFDAASRKETISKIATGDYDMIIMTHEHLNMLPMNPEVVQAYIKDEIKELEATIKESKKDDPRKSNKVVTELEKAKKRLEADLQKSLSATPKDDAVFFEETGIDTLLVDEFHKYKSLPCRTKQTMMKGVPTGRSQRATAMQMRSRWLQEQNGGRGLIAATGTPVANTMAELYNMQRYLQPEELKERGIHNFDAWANAFGEVDTKPEFTVSGYKPVSRFSKFVNIPELMQITRQMMDVQRADDMVDSEGKPSLVRPARKDSVVAAPRTEAMDNLMESLRSRALALKGRRDPDNTDNMLVICTDGRKGAVDMRLLDASAPDDPNSKTNQAIGNVLRLQKAKPGTAQLIFCDIGVNPMKKSAGGEEGEAEEADTDASDVTGSIGALAGSATGFHLYGDIIDKLVKGGIPRDKIADFSKLKGAQKEAAMEAMRRGEMLVGIGSTDKLGTGVNVQDRLAALHHLDVPWLPASLEQRDGRGWRQGNINDPSKPEDQQSLGIYRYVSEGSLDQTFWQVIANKSRFIKQVITSGDKSVRTARNEDTEELTPEQLMAAASGDPRVLEKVNLDDQLKQLHGAQARHDREQAKFRDTVRNTERNLPHMERRVQTVRKDADAMESHPDFAFEVGGKKFDKQGEAEDAFKQWQRDNPEMIASRYGSQRVGSFRGFPVVVEGAAFYLEGPSGEKYKTGDSVASMAYNAKRMTANAASADAEVGSARADIERLKGQIGKAFPRAQELSEKVQRARELNAELSGKKHPFMADEPVGGKHAVAVRQADGTLDVRIFDSADDAAEEVRQQGRYGGLDRPRSAVLPEGMKFRDLQRQVEGGFKNVDPSQINYHHSSARQPPMPHARLFTSTTPQARYARVGDRFRGPGERTWLVLSSEKAPTTAPWKHMICAVPYEKEAPRQGDDARAYARFLAGLFSDLEAAGAPPSRAQWQDACEELADSGWTLRRHGDRTWYAHELDDKPSQHRRVKKGTEGAVQRTNASGHSWWIDAEQAAREEAQGGKRKVGATHAASRERRKARGTTKEGLLERLRPHASGEALDPKAMRGAKAGARMLTKYHGELAMHRLDELVDMAEKGLAKGGAKAGALKARLGQLHAMAGLLGGGGEGPAKEGAKKQEAPAAEPPHLPPIGGKWPPQAPARKELPPTAPPTAPSSAPSEAKTPAAAEAPKPAPAAPAPARPAKPAFVRPADIVAGMPGAQEYLAKKQELKTHEWPNMSREQEKHQFEEVGRLKASNPQKAQAIRNMLIEANVGLANSAANAFAPKGGDVEELRQEALFKLTKLVNDDEFDPSLGYKFSTFAKDAITKHLISKATKEGKLRKKFQTGQGGDDSETDVVANKEDTRNDVRGNQHRVSEVVAGMMKKATPAELPPRARQVIEMRHGMGEFQGDRWVPHESGDPDKELTFKAIGAHFGVTAPAAQQAYKAALKKLQPVVERQGVTSESFRKRALVLQYIKRALEA